MVSEESSMLYSLSQTVGVVVPGTRYYLQYRELENFTSCVASAKIPGIMAVAIPVQVAPEHSKIEEIIDFEVSIALKYNLNVLIIHLDRNVKRL